MKTFAPLLLAALCAAAAPAHAGPYADAVGQCLVEATDPKERAELSRWIFGTVALHPDVAAVSALTAAQRDALNRSAAALLQRLITENCRKPTQDALRTEGPASLQLGFQVLGQAAMQDLLAHPQVRRGFADTARYLDAAKLLELSLGLR
jgi:hypothetical protein